MLHERGLLSQASILVPILVSGAVLAGCAHFREDMVKVSIGEKSTEVVSALGRGYEEKPYADGTLWVFKDSSDVCVIPFKNERVSTQPVCKSIPKAMWEVSRTTYGGDTPEGAGEAATRNLASQQAAFTSQVATQSAAANAASAAAVSSAAATATASIPIMPLH